MQSRREAMLYVWYFCFSIPVLAESMNNHIIGGVVGTVLAILMAGIILVVIIFLCRCYLVYRTAYKMSMIQKKTDQWAH